MGNVLDLLKWCHFTFTRMPQMIAAWHLTESVLTVAERLLLRLCPYDYTVDISFLLTIAKHMADVLR